MALSRRGARAARARRRSSASGVFFPDGATVHPGLLVRALRREAIDAGVTLHERTPCAARRATARSTTPRRRAPRAGDRARDERRADGLAARRAEPDELRLVRRPHRAGARAARARSAGRAARRSSTGGCSSTTSARLDDGRVLMGSGSGPIGFGGRIDDRFTPRPADGGARGGGAAAAAARARRARGSSGRGAGRSTSRPTICRSSARSPARGSTTAPATRATASARAGSAARSSRRSRSAPTTSGRGLPLATRHVPRLPPEPLRRLGGGLVRSAIMACEDGRGGGTPPAARRASGRRAAAAARTGARHPLSQGVYLAIRPQLTFRT